MSGRAGVGPWEARLDGGRGQQGRSKGSFFVQIPHIKVGPEETPRLQYLRFASVSLYPSNEDVSLAVSRILKSFNYPSASLICAKAECEGELDVLFLFPPVPLPKSTGFPHSTSSPSPLPSFPLRDPDPHHHPKEIIWSSATDGHPCARPLLGPGGCTLGVVPEVTLGPAGDHGSRAPSVVLWGAVGAQRRESHPSPEGSEPGSRRKGPLSGT